MSNTKVFLQITLLFTWTGKSTGNWDWAEEQLDAQISAGDNSDQLAHHAQVVKDRHYGTSKAKVSNPFASRALSVDLSDNKTVSLSASRLADTHLSEHAMRQAMAGHGGQLAEKLVHFFVIG